MLIKKTLSEYDDLYIEIMNTDYVDGKGIKLRIKSNGYVLARRVSFEEIENIATIIKDILELLKEQKNV